MAYRYPANIEILRSKRVLTSSEVKNLIATPIELIPAPGAGKVIVVVNGSGKLTYGGSEPFIIDTNYYLYLNYNSGKQITGPAAIGNILIATENSFSTFITLVAFGSSSQFEDNSVKITTNSPVEISGNTSNNNTVTIDCIYYIVTI